MKTFALLGLLSALAFGACSPDDPVSTESRVRLAVIPKGTTHEFWKAVHRGARRAAAELDVDIVWKGPLQENDRAGQIQVVRQFITQKVSGIVLAPLDENALVGPVQQANTAGIPVVIFDSALASDDAIRSFVATDNFKSGRAAGQHVKSLLPASGGKVVMLRYVVGSASTTKREAGFLEGLGDGVEVLSSDQYAGASVQSAKTKALNMLATLRQADAVFCPNESATVGMLLALRQENLLEKVKFVGFDSSEVLAGALKDGDIDALILQDPENMGYLAVRSATQAAKNEAVEAAIDTGFAIATQANMDSPEIARLLK